MGPSLALHMSTQNYLILPQVDLIPMHLSSLHGRCLFLLQNFLKVNTMDNEFYILIADRNRHVREFLRRELIAEGYRIQVAKDGREVLVMTEGAEPPDLLILDLDMPYVNGLTILDRLRERSPLLPVVIHTFLTEDVAVLNVRHAAAVVEKSGNTDCLKAAVDEVFQQFYPHRFALGRQKGPAGTNDDEGAK